MVFEKDGTHYLMQNHWKPSNLQDSGYSILPIEVGKGQVAVSFQEYTEF